MLEKDCRELLNCVLPEQAAIWLAFQTDPTRHAK
jgi:hypothetical protein